MPQSALRGVLQATQGIVYLHLVLDRIDLAVLHSKLDVDDVLVLGEHAGLMLQGTHARDVDPPHLVDDRRVPPQALQLHFTLHLAEAEHDATLLLV